jgi:hypothetical protein
MSGGTIRLRSTDRAAIDSQETVIGEMGYQWHFQPNETRVMADNEGNRTLSANATVSLGSTVQQEGSPNVLLDDDDNVAVS